MATKIRVFVSYSHLNTAIRKAVVSALDSDPSLPFECRWDAAKAHTDLEVQDLEVVLM